MKLQLHANGSTELFSNYLKKFGKLRKSLLLEIDPTQQKFICKSFTEDHSVVRYSDLSFSDANLELVKCDDISTNRIKLGIIVTLDKIIKIIDRFDSNFDLTFSFDVLNQPDGSTDYVCDFVDFKSNVLKMRVAGSKISEFHYLPDVVFNDKVFKVTESAYVPVTADVIQNIIKTSDIVAVDPKKDILVFYTKDSGLYVKDSTGRDANGVEKEPNFEYCIADNIAVPDYPVRLPISREKIVNVLTDSKEDYNIILGKDVMGNVSRILFESSQGNTKIVISHIEEV